MSNEYIINFNKNFEDFLEDAIPNSRAHFIISESIWNNLQHDLLLNETEIFEEDYFDTDNHLLFSSHYILIRRYILKTKCFEWILKLAIPIDNEIKIICVIGEQTILNILKQTFVEFDDAIEITDFCQNHIISLVNTRIYISQELWIDIVECSTLKSGFIFPILSCNNNIKSELNFLNGYFKIFNKLQSGPTKFMFIAHQLYGNKYLSKGFSKSILEFINSTAPNFFISSTISNPFSSYHTCVTFDLAKLD